MENDSENAEAASRPSVDDEAYEPTYAEAFPPLRATGTENGDVSTEVPPSAVGTWSGVLSRMAVRSSYVTQASLLLLTKCH